MADRTRYGFFLALPLAFALACAPPPSRAADAVPGERWCDVDDADGPVRDVDRIAFVGNRVTRPEVMLREIPQQIGAPCSLDRVVDGIQGIMDLGLFRSVRAELALDAERLTLRYIVAEKFFFLAIPRLSRTSDGELRSGLQLRWDNFSGRLHEVRLTAERRQEDDGRGREGYVYDLDYRVPRFLASDLGLSLQLASERRQVGFGRESTDFGEGVRETMKLRLSVARWVGPGDGVRGLRVFAGIGLEQRDLELTDGSFGPFSGGFDASVTLGVENRALHRESYRRRGHVSAARLSAAGGWSGSDFDYHRLELSHKWYRPLSGGIRNLNVQTRIGISDGGPFGDQAYAIGGGELLRGVAPGRDSGDVRLLLNAEYLAAFFTRPALRHVLFVDVGNVWPKARVRPLALNARAGLGLRYRLRALTRTDLRFDVAWDPDQGRARTYVATSLTF